MGDQVRIEGLSGLRKGLKAAVPGLQKALTAAHKKVADLVVGRAGPRLTTKHGRQAKARIAASGTQRGAFVNVSGPTAFGDEFGSTLYHQFKPHLGTAGYAVYPTIRESGPEIADTYGDDVEREVLERIAKEPD